MKTIRMELPTMQSNHCQMRVQSAVNSVEGVKVIDIQPGKAELQFETDEQKIAALSAIDKSGYPIRSIVTETLDAANGNTMQFKTNINCNGCLTKVTPFMEGANGIDDWNVDLLSTDRLLTVQTNGATEKEIEQLVQQAGFNAERIHA